MSNETRAPKVFSARDEKHDVLRKAQANWPKRGGQIGLKDAIGMRNAEANKLAETRRTKGRKDTTVAWKAHEAQANKLADKSRRG